MRYWLGSAAVAALLAVPSLAPQSYAQAVPGYEAPNYQMLCANGVRSRQGISWHYTISAFIHTWVVNLPA